MTDTSNTATETNGTGTLTWVNGERYEGGYVDEKRQGRGTYTWSDGHKFVVCNCSDICISSTEAAISI